MGSSCAGLSCLHHTGRAAEIVDAGVRNIWVFERSRVRLDVQFNKPLEEVSLNWSADIEADRPSGDDESILPAPFTLLEDGLFTLAADGLSATAEWDAVQSGEFAVSGTDAHGLRNDPFRRALRIIVDGPPTITYTDDEADSAAKPDDIVPVPVYATDDVGVAELELHYEAQLLFCLLSI